MKINLQMQIALLWCKVWLKEKSFFPHASLLLCSSPQSCGFLVCLYSFSWCHGFHSVCTDILERIKNKAGRSFRRTFPLGRSLCFPCRPAGGTSVMDYHTAITLSAHLVCTYCYAGINKQLTNVLLPPSKEEVRVSWVPLHPGHAAMQTIARHQPQ